MWEGREGGLMRLFMCEGKEGGLMLLFMWEGLMLLFMCVCVGLGAATYQSQCDDFLRFFFPLCLQLFPFSSGGNPMTS